MTTPSPAPSTDPLVALPGDGVVLRLDDDAATGAFGARLAAMVVDGFTGDDVPADGFTIHFSGDLGAGKTTAVRALLHRLGVAGRVKSPTYTLVEPYVVALAKSVESRQGLNLYCYHFDFYRFDDPHEWIDAGLREYFADAALRLVEWPERARSDAGTLLPAPDVQVALADGSAADGAGRIATLSSGTPRGRAWLSAAGFATPSRTDVDGC